MTDVIVVGGGPTGLWLAGELRLGGAGVTVLEARPHRDPHSKALTIHPRTLEILDCRGVLDRFLAEGVRIPNGHFGGLPDRMDFSVLDTPYPFTLALVQERTEQLFEQRARGLGAVIERGQRVAGLTAGGVELSDGTVRHARYVVGCDGTRSTVRDAAGIAFPGTPATIWGWLGDVILDEPPRGGVEMISGPHGGLMVVPLPGGVHRIVGNAPAINAPAINAPAINAPAINAPAINAPAGNAPASNAPASSDLTLGELTLDGLRAMVVRIAGTDFGMRDPRWLSRFGNATRQAEAYRRGNVLLAGDAAHMHFPTGGVGMNVGIQDAHNLGWKLAAVVTGRADETLLDTYHEERHPVGADLLRHTRAQTALMAACEPETLALREVLSGLIATAPDMSRQLAERLSGLDVTYRTGRRVSDQRLPDGGTLFERLRDGGHVETAHGLVRPDGHLSAAEATRR